MFEVIFCKRMSRLLLLLKYILLVVLTARLDWQEIMYFDHFIDMISVNVFACKRVNHLHIMIWLILDK